MLTTLPFVVVVTSWAVAIIAGLMKWHQSHGLSWALRPIELIGRASLTHYLLHIVIGYVPLRLLLNDEEWSAQTGIAAFAGYFAIAMPLTVLWFRRFARGPFKSAWARVSGKSKPPHTAG